MNAPHIAVLPDETVSLFSGTKSGVFVDCTLGYAGHAELILEKYPHISYIGIDRDLMAIEFASKKLARFGDRFKAIKGAFSEVFEKIKEENIVGVLADLGVSSLQLDLASRGFGFDSEVLDMRMDTTQALSAKDVVNSYELSDLMRILKEYGEEPNAHKIADLIVKNRPFSSAKKLSDLIVHSFKRGKIHPATLTFQAVRIEVNRELLEISTLLDLIRSSAKDGLIVGIISFHSLEDRIVKTAFKQWATNCICLPNAYRCECGNNHAVGKILTKKPVTATSKEIGANPRSRSAKLRGFKFGGKNAEF